MDESLQFHIFRYAGAQLGDGVKRHFTREDNAGGAERAVYLCGGVIAAVCLRADMDGQRRRGFLHFGNHADIGHNGGIHAKRVQFLRISADLRDFCVGCKGIHSDIQLAAGAMRRFYGARKRFHSESHVCGAQLQLRPAEINGVRTEIERRFQTFQITCGRKQFNFLHSASEKR